MADADPDGSMLAVIGGTVEDAETIAGAAGITVANDNAPGQVVLSGPRDGIARAEEVARERGTRTMPVDVAGAFHSPSMEPAVEPFRAALGEVEIRDGAFTVFSCASARPFADVRDELATALIRPVRWRETVIALHEAGASRFVEPGPGKLLARMGKRILPGVPVEHALEAVHA
jgi:malonyl CoA-acyl carrier protein transacylase